MFGWFKRDKTVPQAVDTARELYVRNAELASRNKTFALLQRLDAIALASLGTAEMAHAISELLIKEFNYPFAGIALVDSRRRACRWISISCAVQDQSICDVAHLKKIPLTAGAHPCVIAMKTGRRVTVRQLETLLGGSATKAEQAAFKKTVNVQSCLVFPLLSSSGPMGVLVAGLNRTDRDLTKYEKESFGALANLVTVALEKAQTFSSLVETARNLKAANAKLTKLDAAKTEFLSIASHQLRTPLSIIRGYVTMMQEGAFGKTTERQGEVVVKIRSSTESMIELVNQLLSVSRIESGRTTVEINRMHVVPLCKEVKDFLSLRAKERGLTLTCDTPKMAMVLGDTAKVKEVITNLVENALKYTDKGFVRVKFFDEPQFVRVEVQDSGNGLTKEDIGKLFQKFSRAASSAVNGAAGTGLGLYVCKRLIEAMGGEIWASSAGRGKGSVFAFRLKKAPLGKGTKTMQKKVV